MLRGLVMKTVFILWRYEETEEPNRPPVVWSVHKTMDGATKEMRKYQTDGFICETTLKD